MKENQRLLHLDYLRGFIIFLVVVFHVSITFMARVPQWWYVKSSDSSMLFTLPVIILDTFMMPVLFFIGGHVLIFSMRKNSMSQLTAKRFKRLGIPWVVCTLLFSPWLSLLTARETGNNTSYIKMVTHGFWTEYYSQGPYWFLGILLSFTLLLLLFKFIAGNRQASKMIPTGVIQFSLFFISFAGYTAGSFFYGVDTWVNPLYIWSFQPSRILTYLTFFIAGHLLSEKEWKSNPGIVRWAVTALISAAGFTVMKGKTDVSAGFAAYAVQGLFYSGLAVSTSLFLSGFFAKKCTGPSSIPSFMSRHSFMVYLVHLPILTLIAQHIAAIKTSIFPRWFLLLAAVLMLSVSISMAVNFVNGKLRAG